MFLKGNQPFFHTGHDCPVGKEQYSKGQPLLGMGDVLDFFGRDDPPFLVFLIIRDFLRIYREMTGIG